MIGCDEVESLTGTVHMFHKLANPFVITGLVLTVFGGLLLLEAVFWSIVIEATLALTTGFAGLFVWRAGEARCITLRTWFRCKCRGDMRGAPACVKERKAGRFSEWILLYIEDYAPCSQCPSFQECNCARRDFRPRLFRVRLPGPGFILCAHHERPADPNVRRHLSWNRAEHPSYEDPADGQIYTRTVLGVDEVFKGTLPPLVKLVHRGGTVGDKGEMDGFAPQFKVGEERLVLVSRRADGTLYATRGGASALRLPAESSATTATLSSDLAAGQALLLDLRNRTVSGAISGSDVTDQAASSQDLTTPAYAKGPSPLTNPSSTATNLLTDTNGIPARFILPDRAEPIPYLIDADYLPAGITQTQAVTAVQTALAAWTNVTSLRYRFAGLQSFGMAASVCRRFRWCPPHPTSRSLQLYHQRR